MNLTKAKARVLLPHVLAAIRLFKGDAGTQRAFAALAKIREAHDDDFAAVFLDWVDGIKADLADIDADDKADFIAAIKSAFDVDPLLVSYRGVLDKFLSDYQDAWNNEVQIQTNWDKANAVASDSVLDAVGTFFSQFASDQQDRIRGILQNGLDAGDATPKIASDLAAGMGNIAYLNSDGDVIRTLSPEDWSNQVARTETNRAYAEATNAALTAAGLTTWQWLAAAGCCDECDSNDQEIVNIGDDFPSGDDQPPAHPNCRCVVTAVAAELLGDNSDEG